MIHLEGRDDYHFDKDRRNNKEFKVLIDLDTKELSPSKHKSFRDIKEKTKFTIKIYPDADKRPELGI